MRGVRRFLVVGSLIVVGLLASRSEPVSAHAFLVGTSPAQGERLSASPGVIVFEFSESVDPVSVEVEVRTADGGPVATGDPEVTSGGLEVRVDVAELPTDTYVVTWAVSGLDGHGSGGEFAFAVGNAGGSIPGASVRSPTSLLGVGAAVLFFVGLAIAMGTLVLRWRRADDGAGPMVTRAGLAVSAIGVVVMLLASDGERLLLLLCLQSLLVALALVGLERGRALICGVPVLIAAGLWSARGHVASQQGVVGWGVDVVHLVAGAAWLGSLVLTARAGWRVRRQREQLIRRVRAYSRVVPMFVVVLSAAGVLASILVLPSWRSLYETGYGRLLILKVSMLLAALLLAAAARWWFLRRRRAGGLTRLMGAEVAVLVTALVAAAFLVNGSPPRPAAASDELLGPSPLEGSTVRDAGLAGQLTVGIVADGQRLQLDVFTSTGPLRASDVAVEIRDPDGSVTDLVPRPCGPGCYTQHLTLDDGVTGVAVTVSTPEWIGGTFEGELVSPPGPPAGGVLRDVVTTMRAIPELILTETVDSGPGSQVIPGSITISGDRFIESEPYAAANIDDARMMPGTPRRLALYIPGEQIYAILELDDENRIVAERLVAPAHEITRTFTYPDD